MLSLDAATSTLSSCSVLGLRPSNYSLFARCHNHRYYLHNLIAQPFDIQPADFPHDFRCFQPIQNSEVMSSRPIADTLQSGTQFPSCRVAGMTDDLSSPHRPVRLLARSQSSTLQISFACVFPSCFRSSSLPFSW